MDWPFQEVISKATNALQEFLDCNKQTGLPSSLASPQPSAWIPPHSPMLKINFHAIIHT